VDERRCVKQLFEPARFAHSPSGEVPPRISPIAGFDAIHRAGKFERYAKYIKRKSGKKENPTEIGSGHSRQGRKERNRSRQITEIISGSAAQKNAASVN